MGSVRRAGDERWGIVEELKHHNSKQKKTKKQIKNQKSKKQKKMYIFFLHPNTGLLIEN